MTSTNRSSTRAQARGGLAAVALILVIAACSGGRPPPNPDSPGAQIFTNNCARCHGSDATGQIGPNLTEGKTEEQVRTAVTNGVGARMPSFKDDLTPEQIDTVAAYIARAGESATPAPDSRDSS